MPCADPMPDEAAQKYLDMQAANNTEAVRILCEACRGALSGDELRARMRSWWAIHQAVDAERERLQAAGNYHAGPSGFKPACHSDEGKAVVDTG